MMYHVTSHTHLIHAVSLVEKSKDKRHERIIQTKQTQIHVIHGFKSSGGGGSLVEVVSGLE